MEHEGLIAEMGTVETMFPYERIDRARRRREQQLLNYSDWTTNEIIPIRQLSQYKVKFIHEDLILDVVCGGDFEELRELLSKGMDPNVYNYEGITALHQCCIEGNLSMAKYLIQNGASVNKADGDGWTPLHVAAACSHKELVNFLVNEGADLLAINTDRDMPYEKADEDDTLHILETHMVKQGITQEIIDKIHNEMYQSLKNDINSQIKLELDLNTPKSAEGETLLHIAVANFYNDLVEFLLKNHVSTDIPDCEGWYPIHAAAYWGNIEAFQLISDITPPDLKIKTEKGETIYDLCRDATLKKHIHSLMKKESSRALLGSLQEVDNTNNDEIDFNKDEFFDNQRATKISLIEGLVSNEMERKNSTENLPAINPLLNPLAREETSDKRNSLRLVKRTGMLQKETNNTEPPTKENNNTERPTKENNNTEPPTKEKTKKEQHNQTLVDNANKNKKKLVHEVSETNPQNGNIQQDDLAHKRNKEEVKIDTNKINKRQTEEPKTKSKNKAPAPPPPPQSVNKVESSSTQEVKNHQSSKNEEQKKMKSTENNSIDQKKSTLGSSKIYEPPPSPTRIRYRFVQKDTGEKDPSIVKKRRKCTII